MYARLAMFYLYAEWTVEHGWDQVGNFVNSQFGAPKWQLFETTHKKEVSKIKGRKTNHTDLQDQNPRVNERVQANRRRATEKTKGPDGCRNKDENQARSIISRRVKTITLKWATNITEVKISVCG